MLPDVGANSPWHSRMSTLFPAPFGPRMTVRGPSVISIDTRSMIVLPSTAKETWSRTRAACSAVAALSRFLDPVRARVQREYQRDEDDAQPQRERQVALAGLERDRR